MDASIALIASAAGSALAWKLTRTRLRRPPKPRARPSLLKPNLRYVYGQLREAVGDEWSLQADVAVSRLIAAKPTGKRTAKSKDKSKRRVDFVLCDHELLRPRLAVLVGPADHQSPAAPYRSLVKQLEASGMPCLVIDPDREVDLDELGETIAEMVADEDGAAS